MGWTWRKNHVAEGKFNLILPVERRSQRIVAIVDSAHHHSNIAGHFDRSRRLWYSDQLRLLDLMIRHNLRRHSNNFGSGRQHQIAVAVAVAQHLRHLRNSRSHTDTAAAATADCYHLVRLCQHRFDIHSVESERMLATFQFLA